MIDYIPPYPVKVADIVTWRIGEPREAFDQAIIESQGIVILRIECENGVFLVMIKKERK